MACPYFMPTERLEGGAFFHTARLPLGCGWSGHCTAPGHEGERPETDDLRGCNLGYADSCLRMPPDRPWDALRFALRALREGSDAAAGVLELQYVCERQHRPAECGILEYDAVSLKWVRPHADARVQKMAECFLQVHLEKKRGGAAVRVGVG